MSMGRGAKTAPSPPMCNFVKKIFLTIEYCILCMTCTRVKEKVGVNIFTDTFNLVVLHA